MVMQQQQQQQQMAMATPFMNPLAAFGFGASPFGGLFPGMDMMDPFAGGGGKLDLSLRVEGKLTYFFLLVHSILQIYKFII